MSKFVLYKRSDKMTYRTLHDWVNSVRGKASYCLFVNEGDCSKTFDWANISGEYLPEILDFMPLCRSHHKRYDYRRKKGCYF